MNLRDWGLRLRGNVGGVGGNRTLDQRIKSPFGSSSFAPKLSNFSLRQSGFFPRNIPYFCLPLRGAFDSIASTP